MPETLPETRERNSGYIPELDTFRTLAILLVMCLHWLPDSWFINSKVQYYGNWGVYLFFVLSGFLITRILMRCRENCESRKVSTAFSIRQFYIRRFLRIFPIYYFVLLLTAALNVWTVRAILPWHFLYLSNVYFYLKHGLYGPSGLFWSLAVEEQFYLLWPFAIMLLPLRAIVPFVVVTIVGGTLCHDIALLNTSPFGIMTPACVNFLALGALVAVCESPLCGSVARRRNLLRIYLTLGAGVSVFAIAAHFVSYVVRHPQLDKAIVQTGVSLLLAWIIATAATGIPGILGACLRWKPAVYLGKISYGLYVYHAFVKVTLVWFAPHLGRLIGTSAAQRILTDRPSNDWAGVVVVYLIRFVSTVAVASASWFILEKPLNDLKRFFPYSNKPRSLALEERGIPIPQSAPDSTAAITQPDLAPGT